MSKTFNRQDRDTSRYVHRLFWRANFVDVPGMVVWFLCRPAALFIYNVLIPLQIAYGLQAILTRQFESVNRYAWTIFFLGLAYCVLWTVGGIWICRNGKVGTEYVVKDVFINYLGKDYEYYNNTFTGTLGAQVMRLKDSFNEYCVVIFNNVTKHIIVIGSSIAIIGAQSLSLAFVTLLAIGLVLSFTIISGKWRLRFRRRLSEANSEIAGVLGDALGQAVTVKSFAAEDYEKSRMDTAVKKLSSAQYWSWMSSIPSDVGRMLLASIATLILLIMTARLYETNSIPIAIVILVQLYVIRLVMATQEIADLIKTYETVMSGAHQAVKTMLLEPKVLDKPDAKQLPKNVRYDIALKDVSFKYNDAPGSPSAVKDFTFTIKQGERIGLVGYSGSGKTTLTKLLLRFMDVTGGSISIGGQDIRDITQQSLREQIAYVPQEPLLFHRSIFENIAYGKPGSSKKPVEAVGNMAYVDEFINEMPEGYDTLVGEKGVKLSGGQRQRVAIARALLKDAPVLVLDEATSALDSRSEQFIQKALWRLMKDRTALVIAHRLSTVQRLDRIIVMDKGRIVDVGSHDELLKRSDGIYARLWQHQSGGYLGGTDQGLADIG